MHPYGGNMFARERVHSQEPARRLFPVSVGLPNLVGKTQPSTSRGWGVTSHASGGALRACECGRAYYLSINFYCLSIAGRHRKSENPGGTYSGIMKSRIIIKLQRPERVWFGVRCRRAAGCRVGRPFSGGRHGRVAFLAHAFPARTRFRRRRCG